MHVSPRPGPVTATVGHSQTSQKAPPPRHSLSAALEKQGGMPTMGTRGHCGAQGAAGGSSQDGPGGAEGRSRSPPSQSGSAPPGSSARPRPAPGEVTLPLTSLCDLQPVTAASLGPQPPTAQGRGVPVTFKDSGAGSWRVCGTWGQSCPSLPRRGAGWGRLQEATPGRGHRAQCREK